VHCLKIFNNEKEKGWLTGRHIAALFNAQKYQCGIRKNCAATVVWQLAS
jgi:hypothetical protein